MGQTAPAQGRPEIVRVYVARSATSTLGDAVERELELAAAGHTVLSGLDVPTWDPADAAAPEILEPPVEDSDFAVFVLPPEPELVEADSSELGPRDRLMRTLRRLSQHHDRQRLFVIAEGGTTITEDLSYISFLAIRQLDSESGEAEIRAEVRHACEVITADMADIVGGDLHAATPPTDSRDGTHAAEGASRDPPETTDWRTRLVQEALEQDAGLRQWKTTAGMSVPRLVEVIAGEDEMLVARQERADVEQARRTAAELRAHPVAEPREMRILRIPVNKLIGAFIVLGAVVAVVLTVAGVTKLLSVESGAVVAAGLAIGLSLVPLQLRHRRREEVAAHYRDSVYVADSAVERAERTLELALLEELVKPRLRKLANDEGRALYRTTLTIVEQQGSPSCRLPARPYPPQRGRASTAS